MKRALLALVLTASSACGDGADSKQSGGTQETVVPAEPQETELTVGEKIDVALQGEYLAEFTYLRIVADLGPVEPFASIVTAPAQHSQMVVRLYAPRDRDVPASEWSLENVPHYADLNDACLAGQVIEEAAVARYDAWLATSLPADVERVFTDLRDSSRDRRLPAFETCLQATGAAQQP